jgi:hypothetical protein
MRFLKWIMARLGGPLADRAVIAIALVLATPSLFSGLFIDEYVQAARWRAGLWSFLRTCFVFGSGDQATNQREFHEGLGAWWTAPDFKTAFWRPLSAVTHGIDLSLWPGNAMLMHVHTLLWFFGLLFALRVLFRRFLPPRVATLALALYAWDDARGQVLSWIAKRNALIGGLFGVSAIIAYDKWRRDGWRPGAWLAPVLFALSLLSAEMALAVAGFLLAHALWLDTGALSGRLARLWPIVLIVATWQAAYLAGGYGATASANYVHPLHEPFAYAVKLVTAAPILLLGQLTPIGADFWGLYPPAVKAFVVLLAVAVLAALARIAWPHLARDPEARFWLAGAALSVVPISASAPADQNLVFVGIGMSAALAMTFASFVGDPPASKWPRFAIGALAIFNLAIGPMLLPPKCLTMLAMGYGLAQTDESIPRDPAISRKTLVAVWLVSEGGVYAASNLRVAQAAPWPKNTRILATSFGNVSVIRLDDVTLRLRPDNGFFEHAMQQLMRGPSRPFHDGETVQLSDMRATVTEITDDKRPRTVEFRFAEPLESPKWLWMRGEGMRLVGWTPPKVGETVVVPGAL